MHFRFGRSTRTIRCWSPSGSTEWRHFCETGMLPDFTPWGDLPVGVHVTQWEEFSSRFGVSTPRRMWLLSRLQAVLSIAGGTGKLRRVFVWGSFVTTKAS